MVIESLALPVVIADDYNRAVKNTPYILPLRAKFGLGDMRAHAFRFAGMLTPIDHFAQQSVYFAARQAMFTIFLSSRLVASTMLGRAAVHCSPASSFRLRIKNELCLPESNSSLTYLTKLKNSK